MRHLVTVAFLAAAVAAYAASARPGLCVAFLVVGMLCEGVFWWRLVRGRRLRQGGGNDAP
jgi:hypothetical protein